MSEHEHDGCDGATGGCDGSGIEACRGACRKKITASLTAHEAPQPAAKPDAASGRREGPSAAVFPEGWWRSRTRAQLQVEYASRLVRLLVEERAHYAWPFRPGDCLACNGSVRGHDQECPLGNDLASEQIAAAVEGLA